MTDEHRRRITDAIHTWVTPLLLLIVFAVGASTWNKVNALSEAMPTVEYRLNAHETNIRDLDKRVRYVERVVPAKEQWP